MSDSPLLTMQAPKGIPRSTIFDVVTDPLLPPSQTTQMLAHFYEPLYNLKPEGHLSRLLKVILGDTGAGKLRKHYTYAHLSQALLTTHYNDLDQLYASIFGLKRLFRERLTINPSLESATADEWEAIDAADASYRSRIEAFSHSIPMAGTPDGMLMAANAVLGTECRLYEVYRYIDDADLYTPLNSVRSTWSDQDQLRYLDLENHPYSSLEGLSNAGRLLNSRSEFVIRPLRTITDEERYHLTKTLTRLKPSEALMSIDARPGNIYASVPVFAAVASSSYWHVRSMVKIDPDNSGQYDRYSPDVAVEQPRPAFSYYQGEAWTYNSNVLAVTSSVEDFQGNVIQTMNYERRTDSRNQTYDYSPDLALMDPAAILRGRSVSDGVLSAPAVSRETS